MIQSAAVAAKPKDESDEEEEDLVIATIRNHSIFDSSKECKLVANQRIPKDLEHHPTKIGMPRSSAFTLNNTNIPSSMVEAKLTVFVLEPHVLDSEVHSVYEQVAGMVSKTEKVLANHNLRLAEQNGLITHTHSRKNGQPAVLLRLLFNDFSKSDGDGNVHTAEGAKSKKDDDDDISTQSKNSCDEWKRLHKTNSLNKILKLDRAGVVDGDLQTNKYLSSKADWSSNNQDDNTSDADG